MPIVDIQERYRELGRIRYGMKGERHPILLETFRFTTPDRAIAEAVAREFGGSVQSWESPRGQEWEVVTDAARLRCLVPPQRIQEAQWYELWGREGDKDAIGLLRRCDGTTQQTGDKCVCDPDDRACKPRTHLLIMLPQIPGLGVWRITSGGFNAARELPVAAELLSRLAAEGATVQAVLSLRKDRSVVAGQVHRYVVPQLDISMTAAELIASLPPGIGERVLTAPGRAAAIPTDTGRPSLPGTPASAALPASPAPISTPDDEPPSGGLATAPSSGVDPSTIRDHLAALPADSDTMQTWEAWCRTLFDLMEAAGHWNAGHDGADPLHMALWNQHRAAHVGDLKKAQLVAFAKRAHAAATAKME